ncbi:MAG: Os1348 family NHLP clan protein [Anaerolineaceae bacterium]|nr:Os1348 family NHLP clan protein [Anaerolineaceae bacterium]
MAKQEEEKIWIEELAAFTDRLTGGKRVKPIENAALRELADTVIKIHAIAVNAVPSPEFSASLRRQVLAELPEPTPQPTFSERFKDVVARLLGEADFRDSFFASPEAALRRAGIRLSPVEIAALKEMEPENMQEWFSDLDERISKSGLGGGIFE